MADFFKQDETLAMGKKINRQILIGYIMIENLIIMTSTFCLANFNDGWENKDEQLLSHLGILSVW